MSLSLAILGLGGLGRAQTEALADIDGVEVAAGVDVSPESCERYERDFGVPTYEDYRTLLEERGELLDAASIITPHTLHFEQALAFLEADVHVHLEKPMVTDVADGETLIECARERDLVLQIGYQRHFHPGYRAVKEAIEAGRIGEVHMASCYLAQDWLDVVGGSWRTVPELSGGGQLADSGSHLLDTLLWTTDSTPRTVAAVTDHWDQDVDVNSAVAALLDGPDRTITASIGVSGDGHSFEERLTVWGTEGWLSYEDGRLTVDDGSPSVTEFDEPTEEELIARKLEAFVEAVVDGGPSPVPGEFGLRVTRLTEAAFRASERGETVDATTL